MSDAWEPVASVAEIAPGGRMSVVFDDRAVLVFRIADDFYAVEDVCSHDGQPLTDGPVFDTQVECPRHGARFNIITGKPTKMPAFTPIAVFETRVDAGQVWLRRP